MEVVEVIHDAAGLHTQLHRLAANNPAGTALRDLFQQLREKLNGIRREASERSFPNEAVQELDKKVQNLLVDAEFHAGLGDAEGYRYQREALDQYDWIRDQFRRQIAC